MDGLLGVLSLKTLLIGHYHGWLAWGTEFEDVFI